MWCEKRMSSYIVRSNGWLVRIYVDVKKVGKKGGSRRWKTTMKEEKNRSVCSCSVQCNSLACCTVTVLDRCIVVMGMKVFVWLCEMQFVVMCCGPLENTFPRECVTRLVSRKWRTTKRETKHLWNDVDDNDDDYYRQFHFETVNSTVVVVYRRFNISLVQTEMPNEWICDKTCDNKITSVNHEMSSVITTNSTRN